jgi:hypothetical protein
MQIKRTALLVLALGLLLLQSTRVLAAAELHWQVGFPMRMGEQVMLMWIPFVGATSYEVRRIDETAKTEKRFTTATFQYQDTTAVSDHTYRYMIKATMSDGTPGPMSSQEILEAVVPPKSPEPGGIARSKKGTLLVWDEVQNAAFYNVYRLDDKGATSNLGSAQLPRYTDKSSKKDMSYTYFITAVGFNALESPRSEPMKVGPYEQITPAKATTEYELLKFNIAGIYGKKDLALKSPTDISIANGLLYITDSGNERVAILGQDGELLGELTKSKLKYSAHWGMPWGLDVADDGAKVAVTYLRSSKVRVIDSRKMELVLDVKVLPPENIEEDLGPTAPMDVALDPDGGLWVSESTYAQVIRYDAEGRELFRVGNPVNPSDGLEPGPFKSPTFLVYNIASSEVQVVDALSARVYSINSGGKIVSSWWRFTAKDGPINLPKGIQYTPGGDLLMVDGIFSTLQTVSPTGELKKFFTPEDAKHKIKSVVSAVLSPEGERVYAVSKIRGVVYVVEVGE